MRARYPGSILALFLASTVLSGCAGTSPPGGPGGGGTPTPSITPPPGGGEPLHPVEGAVLSAAAGFVLAFARPTGFLPPTVCDAGEFNITSGPDIDGDGFQPDATAQYTECEVATNDGVAVLSGAVSHFDDDDNCRDFSVSSIETSVLNFTRGTEVLAVDRSVSVLGTESGAACPDAVIESLTSQMSFTIEGTWTTSVGVQTFYAQASGITVTLTPQEPWSPAPPLVPMEVQVGNGFLCLEVDCPNQVEVNAQLFLDPTCPTGITAGSVIQLVGTVSDSDLVWTACGFAREEDADGVGPIRSIESLGVGF